MRLYNPMVTDFMITEDGGGTQTEWTSKDEVWPFGDVELTFDIL